MAHKEDKANEIDTMACYWRSICGQGTLRYLLRVRKLGPRSESFSCTLRLEE